MFACYEFIFFTLHITFPTHAHIEVGAGSTSGREKVHQAIYIFHQINLSRVHLVLS